MISCAACCCIILRALNTCKTGSIFLTQEEFENYFPVYNPKNRYEKCPFCRGYLNAKKSRICYSTNACFHDECGLNWFA